jgi:hypothetical protein
MAPLPGLTLVFWGNDQRAARLLRLNWLAVRCSIRSRRQTYAPYYYLRDETTFGS